MNIVINVFENPFQCIRVFPCYMSKPRFPKMMSSDVLACKQTFYFSFHSFQKRWWAKRARSARKKNKEYVYLSSPTTTPLRWWSINPLRFIFYHPRSTDFEEKIERLYVNKLVERGLFNYSPDRISPIKTSLYGVYVSSFLPYPGREFLCWFKIISLRSDWYMKENFNRSDRFGEFKLLLTTGDGQPSFVTLVQKRGQFSLRSVGLPCDTLILVFIMTCLIVRLLEG